MTVKARRISDYPHVPQVYLDVARTFSNPLLMGPPICDELIAFVRHLLTEEEAAVVLKRLKVDVASVRLKVETLSGGRQQSVAIARAIVSNPKVVILDEPTANLSVTATAQLLDTMQELKGHGVAQIIISHRLNDIFAVGDRVMVLKRGRLVGDRIIKQTSEDEVLGMIVQGGEAVAAA